MTIQNIKVGLVLLVTLGLQSSIESSCRCFRPIARRISQFLAKKAGPEIIITIVTNPRLPGDIRTPLALADDTNFPVRTEQDVIFVDRSYATLCIPGRLSSLGAGMFFEIRLDAKDTGDFEDYIPFGREEFFALCSGSAVLFKRADSNHEMGFVLHDKGYGECTLIMVNP